MSISEMCLMLMLGNECHTPEGTWGEKWQVFLLYTPKIVHTCSSLFSSVTLTGGSGPLGAPEYKISN